MPDSVSPSWSQLNDAPMKIVFIAGPYIGDGRLETIERNIRSAEEYAVALANRRIGFFCPHLHTHHFGSKADADESFYHRLDFHFLMRSDAILMMPQWRGSSGARRERDWAIAKGLPVFYPQSANDLRDIVVWNESAVYRLEAE